MIEIRRQERRVEEPNPPDHNLPWLVVGDYGGALVHLAWYTNMDTGHRTLIFGLVELYPAELSSLDTTKELRYSLKVPSDARGGKRRHRLYVQRFCLSLKKAVAWYDACRVGKVTIPVEGDFPLEHSAFVEEPRWPQLASTNDVSFLTANWRTVRAHHFRQLSKPESVALVMGNEKAVDWLSQQLFFNIEDYPEWAGSIHLMAPNPVYRELDCRRESSTDKKDCTVVRVVARSNQTLDGLWFELNEHGPTGIAGHLVRFTGPEIIVPHVGDVLEVSYRVLCPKRGLLEWIEPAPYIGGIRLSQGEQSESVAVYVPARRQRPAETYQRTIVGEASDTWVGEPSTSASLNADLIESRANRQDRQPERQLTERFFYNEQDVATDFVRNQIALAHSRVVILDRYFDAAEFWRYAMNISRRNLSLTIITSAKWLHTPDRDRPEVDKAAELRDALRDNRAEGRFNVLVMPGDPPLFHDRFLVIDKDVWLIGSSFHSLGQSAGMAIKLAYPQPVITRIESIVHDRAFPVLDDWMQDHPFTPKAISYKLRIFGRCQGHSHRF